MTQIMKFAPAAKLASRELRVVLAYIDANGTNNLRSWLLARIGQQDELVTAFEARQKAKGKLDSTPAGDHGPPDDHGPF